MDCFGKMCILWIRVFSYVGCSICFMHACLSLSVIVYHFGTSTKCIQQGCEEEMHKSWWISASLQKSYFLVSIEDGGTAKAQPWQCSHKGAMFNLFHSVKVTLLVLHSFIQMKITLLIWICL